MNRTQHLDADNNQILLINDITMNCNRFEVSVGGTPLYLTYTEFKLLEYLIKNANRAVSRDELLREIWQIPDSIETRATDDMVKRLRKKLKTVTATSTIITVRGFGFMISNEKQDIKSILVEKENIPTFIKEIIEDQPLKDDNSLTLKIKVTNDYFELIFS